MATGIPKEFQLLGHTIKVRVIPRSRWRHGMGVVGYWDPQKYRIDIRGDQPETAIQQCFCHELTHAICDQMSHEISQDEKFVDTFGGLLQQALTTFRTE